MDEKENQKQPEQKEQNLLEEINQRLIGIEKSQKAERVRRYIRMGINLAILAVLIIFVIPGVSRISAQYQTIKQEYDQINAIIDSIDMDKVNDTLAQVNALDMDKVNAVLDQVNQLDIDEINGIVKMINDSDLEGTIDRLKTDLQKVEEVYARLKEAADVVSSLGGMFG